MTTDNRAGIPERFGHHRVLEELGQGGMGAVYLGIDTTLDRKVALKVLRTELRLDPDRKARLLREARILSQLNHPGVCQLYEFIDGEDADCLVLELVEGVSLHDALASSELDRARKLEIAGQMLEVLIAVHGKGVIHRDLTPNNVMLTPSRGVKLLDFGLARSSPLDAAAEPTRRDDIEEADDSPKSSFQSGVEAPGLTAHGAVVGTAGYMSPEQARGKPATAASDMYSFGLILQEMFTGRSPFADDLYPVELRRRAMWAETEPVIGVPGDLTTMIERLTSLAPGLRPSAVDAAAMLQHMLDRPRRRRRRATVAAVWLTLAAFGAGMTIQFMRAEREAERATAAVVTARSAQIAAEQQRAVTLAESARVAAASGDPLEARAKLRESLEVQDTSLARAVWWQLRHHPLHWSKKLNAAIMGVAFSPDGRTVAAANSFGSIVLFDVQTRASRTLRSPGSWVRAVAYSPDGSELYSTSNEGCIGIWDLRTGGVRCIQSVSSDSIAVCAGAGCPATEGTLLATSGGGGSVLLWDSGTLSHIGSFEDASASRFCFSPDGSLVAFIRTDGSVEIRDTTSGNRLWRRSPSHGVFRDARFAPDGATLVVAGSEGDIRLLATDTGGEVSRLGGGRPGITDLRFLPSGEHLVSVTMDRSMSLWEVASGTEVANFPAHELWIYGLDTSADGRYVASSSEDGTVSLWRTAYRRPLPEDRGHPAEGFGLVFSPDGSRLYSSARDRTIRSWNVASGDATDVLEGHAGTVYAVACDPNGSWLASAGDSTVRLWRVPFDSIPGPYHVLEMPGAVFDVAFTHDGSRIAAVSNDGTIRLWILAAGFVSRQLPRQPGVDQKLRISPDGRFLASADASSGVVRLWDLVGDRPGPAWTHGVRNATGLCFSSDGRRIALAEETGAVHLWSIEDGASRTVRFPDHRVATVATHPDGAICMLENPDRTMSIHNLETGETVPLEGSLSQTNAAFSADGQRLATIGSKGRLHLWDPRTGRPAWRTVALLRSPFELLTHRGWVSLEGIDPRTRGTLKWRAALEDRALVADQSEDGRWLCILDHKDTVELWDLDGDTRIWGHRVTGAFDLSAVGDGCVMRSSEGVVSLLRRSGQATVLAAHGSAVEGLSAEQIFVATEEGIGVFDSDGARVSVVPAPAGVNAIGVADSYLALANGDGTIAFGPRSANAAHPTCTLEDLPLSRVERIVMGPRNTIVIGFENGTLGIWNLDNGDLLHRTHLNGAIHHVELHREVLGFATQAGDFDTLDLSLFSSPYCEVLREVWDETGVVWANGRPKYRPIPVNHECSTPNLADPRRP